jgi:flagellar basal-body rod protein FlgB
MMDLVQRSLDASALSHKVIANNIANVDTPGFKRADVVFSDKLKRALEARQNAGETLALARTDSRHLDPQAPEDLDALQPEVVTDASTSLRNDGNNVDIDHEVSLLSQNTVWYQTLAQITQKQFTDLMSAVHEGRR